MSDFPFGRPVPRGAFLFVVFFLSDYFPVQNNFNHNRQLPQGVVEQGADENRRDGDHGGKYVVDIL